MNRLNEKIAEILKQHPEGEDFFNALDAMIRGDMDILEAFKNFVYSNIENSQDYGLVLTGNFGNAFFSKYGQELYTKFSDIILVSGGIRTGNIPVIFNSSVKSSKFILLDDSFYSGKTRNVIEDSLRDTLNIRYPLITFVIYDGSRKEDDRVYSMFRYHSETKVNVDTPIFEDDFL